MKQKINFIIDGLMFLLIAAISGLGFLIKYILVPGEIRTAKFGRFVDLYFLGLDRHEWGSIHLILAFIMIAFLILHIILHWPQVKGIYRKLIFKSSTRWVLTIIFCVICFFCFMFPFLVPIEIREAAAGEGHHHHSKQSIGHIETENVQDTANTLKQDEADAHRSHAHHVNIDIAGSMTLGQIASEYHVPVDALLSGLKIERSHASGTRLGYLRKRYGFDMNDVAEVITKYKPESVKVSK